MEPLKLLISIETAEKCADPEKPLRDGTNVYPTKGLPEKSATMESPGFRKNPLRLLCQNRNKAAEKNHTNHKCNRKLQLPAAVLSFLLFLFLHTKASVTAQHACSKFKQGGMRKYVVMSDRRMPLLVQPSQTNIFRR